MCASIRSFQRRRIALRSRAVLARHAGHAAAAAAIARFVSFAPSIGAVPIARPVAGLTTVSVALSSAWIQAPPT